MTPIFRLSCFLAVSSDDRHMKASVTISIVDDTWSTDFVCLWSSCFMHWCCPSVCPSVCLSVAGNAYTKVQFSQKLSSLELWCLLETNRKFYVGFSKDQFLDPGMTLSNSKPHPVTHIKPLWKTSPYHKFMLEMAAYWWHPYMCNICSVGCFFANCVFSFLVTYQSDKSPVRPLTDLRDCFHKDHIEKCADGFFFLIFCYRFFLYSAIAVLFIFWYLQLCCFSVLYVRYNV